MIFTSEPSGFADKTWPALALRKNKRAERGLAADLAAFGFADAILFIPFYSSDLLFNFLETCSSMLAYSETAQTSLILRSIVLMTESILPLSTWLAMLNVKPFTV
jgi:hypothetical protein